LLPVKLPVGLTESVMNDVPAVSQSPMRCCFICRESKPKQDVLRFVVDDEGVIWPDLLQKAPGRGVYLCMSELCLGRINDKRLQALKAKFTIVLPQWDELQQRITSSLQQQLKRMFTRQRSSAAIGRDAVMHRLWNNTPIMLIRAMDAGDALVRQIDGGIEKRAQAGNQSLLVNVPTRQWLGEMFDRDDVAIVALNATGPAKATAKKLNVYCVWYGRIKVLGNR